MFEPSPTYARTTLGTLLGALVLALPAAADQATPESQALCDLAAYPYSIVQLPPRARPPVGSTLVSRTLHMWRVRGDVARRLVRAGLVVEAAPDVPLVPLGRLEPSDPLLPTQWWRSAVGADAAPAPGPGVPVTVVDRGLDGSHPEFASRPDTVALNRQRFAREDSEGFHATAVSSVVAAPANGVGLVGAYPQTVLQVWDASPDGVLETSALIRGMDTASARGRTVINLSLGFSGDFFMRTRNVIQQSVYIAVFRGSVVVAAGGNGRDDGSPNFFPADMSHVLTVAATDERGGVASFSSASPALDLAAPGFRIPVAVPFSFNPSGYSLGTGTSYSAAIVSAATAWVWSARPELRNTQIVEVMRHSARDVDPPGFDEDTGFGLLDIPAALNAPAPPPDQLEPNDDISHVATPFWVPKERPARPLTAPGRVRGAIAARVDRLEDPHDVYRVWAPPHGLVTLELDADADADLQLWDKGTRSVLEDEVFRRYDLRGISAHRGTRAETIVYRNRRAAGKFVYADVYMGGEARSASYTLSAASQP